MDEGGFHGTANSSSKHASGLEQSRRCPCSRLNSQRDRASGGMRRKRGGMMQQACLSFLHDWVCCCSPAIQRISGKSLVGLHYICLHRHGFSQHIQPCFNTRLCFRVERQPWLTTTGPLEHSWGQQLEVTWCNSSSTCKAQFGQRGANWRLTEQAKSPNGSVAYQVVSVVLVFDSGVSAGLRVNMAVQVYCARRHGAQQSGVHCEERECCRVGCGMGWLADD